MERLRFDYSNAFNALTEEEWANACARAQEAQKLLHARTGKGSEYLGWVDLPDMSEEEVNLIVEAAEEIQQTSSILVVVGIGGSYLGARAVIEACLPPLTRPAVDILFAGQNIDGRYLAHVLDYLNENDFSLNVISKSGTTTEPAIAFRILRDVMNEQYGTMKTRERIYVTTDPEQGALRKLAYQENYTTFDIPPDVGGRFSVLTPVGLLPIAAAGVNIRALLHGAARMKERLQSTDPQENPALAYAALRNALYDKGKTVEVLAAFQSSLQYVGEWWKQLFGESEGKNGKGLFPAAVVDTTDLHSMGQYIQEGRRDLFETFLAVDDVQTDVIINEQDDDADELNYLAGKTLHEINAMALLGTALAHKDGGVPNCTITMPYLSPSSIGEMLYFFEYAVAVSGYMLGVNPFDQPGVEAYKKNVFGLLGKPGFESNQEELRKRIENAPKRTIE